MAILCGDADLRTGGIDTCAALLINGQGKRLMAHIDAGSDLGQLLSIIRENFNLSRNDLSLSLVPGAGIIATNRVVRDQVCSAIATLGLERPLEVKPIYNNFMQDLVLNKDGQISVASNQRVNAHSLSGRFLTNADPQNVEDLGNGVLRVRGRVLGKDYHDDFPNAFRGPDPYGNEGKIGIFQHLEV